MKNHSHKTRSANRLKEAFTLIEVMLVVMIIGVIAIVAIGNLNIVGTSDQARRTATESLIGQLSTAVDRYFLDVKKMPPNLDALISDPGERDWGGPYLKRIKPDAWGDDFSYSVSVRSYEIISSAGGTEGGPISSNDL